MNRTNKINDEYINIGFWCIILYILSIKNNTWLLAIYCIIMSIKHKSYNYGLFSTQNMSNLIKLWTKCGIIMILSNVLEIIGTNIFIDFMKYYVFYKIFNDDKCFDVLMTQFTNIYKKNFNTFEYIETLFFENLNKCECFLKSNIN